MLLEARGNDHSAVQAQIDKLVNECSAICASLAMSNPSAIRTLHCSNFDGALMVQQGPSSSKWLSISVRSAHTANKAASGCVCVQSPHHPINIWDAYMGTAIPRMTTAVPIYASQMLQLQKRRAAIAACNE